MNQDHITMIMPTYNHPTYIEYFLANSLVTYKGKLFKFEIHDSSTDSQTEDLVRKFNEDHGDIIQYFKYDPSFGGDEKAFVGLSNCKSQHMYLKGDGISPDFNKLEDYLVQKNYFKYDVLGVEPYFFAKRFKKDHFDLDTIYDQFPIETFFGKFFHEFTLYGGSIVSRKIWSYVIQNGIFSRYEFEGRHCFAYCSSLFDALASGDFRYGISFISFYRPNPKKKRNTWFHGEIYYRIALPEFDNDVANLPSVYENSKRAILKKERKISWNAWIIMVLRMDGDVNLRLLRKYRSWLAVSKSSYISYLFFSLTPIWLLKAARWAKRFAKKKLRRGIDS